MRFTYYVFGSVNDLEMFLRRMPYSCNVQDALEQLKGKHYSDDAVICIVADPQVLNTKKFLSLNPESLEVLLLYEINLKTILLEKKCGSNRFIKVDESEGFERIERTLAREEGYITNKLDPFDDLEHYEMNLVGE